MRCRCKPKIATVTDLLGRDLFGVQQRRHRLVGTVPRRACRTTYVMQRRVWPWRPAQNVKAGPTW
jgi:hypothetical protein